MTSGNISGHTEQLRSARENLEGFLSRNEKTPPYGGVFLMITLGSKVARANRDATVFLGAVRGLLDGFLNKGGDALREITGGHHPVLLQEILESGCNDVAHGRG